jgi:serine/threonine-protein kinase
MVFIPPITAVIGEGDTRREVTLSRGFFIERHEVTVRAYQACMGARMCSAANHVAVTPEAADAPLTPGQREFVDMWSRRCNEPRKALDHPINCVDYPNAESYCRFRGRRLPTEAEWEIAARGGEGRAYAWGADEPTCERACYERNGPCRPPAADVATCPSGVHPGDRTPEGIYDLGANVAEWVSDGFVSPPPGGTDPQGDPAALLKIVRGGSFIDEADKLTATYRQSFAPVTAHANLGFRCAMDVPGAGEVPAVHP